MKQRFRVGFDCVGVGIGAAIISPERKLFLALRGEKAKNERFLWETPGGGAEFGETMAETLKREMQEEYGFEIEPVEMLDAYDHILPEEKQHWIAVSYVCRVVSGEPKIMEPGKCEEIGWFNINDAEKLPLTGTGKHDIAQLKIKYPEGLPDLYK